MNTLYVLAISLIFGAGIYLLLSRHLLRMLFGISLISAAANLVILISGRLGATSPPIIPEGATSLPEGAANPLPQALILTAIVIGFALSALLISLLLRTWQSTGTLDGSQLTAAEDLGSPFRESQR